MTVIHWQLLETLNLWQHTLSRLLQNLNLNDINLSDCKSTLWVADKGDGWIPEVQVQETPSEVIVKVHLPKVSVDELNVQVSAETVLLQVIQHPPEHVGTDYFNFEFFPNRCQSLIPIPQMVQPHVAIAQFQDHVLTLTLLKSVQERHSVCIEIAQPQHQHSTPESPLPLRTAALSGTGSN